MENYTNAHNIIALLKNDVGLRESVRQNNKKLFFDLYLIPSINDKEQQEIISYIPYCIGFDYEKAIQLVERARRENKHFEVSIPMCNVFPKDDWEQIGGYEDGGIYLVKNSH